MDRRTMITTAGMTLGTIAVNPQLVLAAEEAQKKKSSFKLGMVTYRIGVDWDLETIINNCEKTGFKGVELRATHAHGVELDLNKQQREDVKKRFADSDVELMGLGSAYDFHTPDQDELRKTIEECKQYMILAHDVGAEGVKVRPNGFPDGVSKEKTLEQIGNSCRELGIFGEDLGVEIRMEVHGRETSLLPNIKKMMDYADHPNVGVCWNSNSSDLAGEGFQHNFDLVKDKIFSVHITDLSNENYPYRQLFKNLNEMGFDGYTLCEFSPTPQDPIIFMNFYEALWKAYQDLV